MILIFTIYLKIFFHLPKNTNRNNSNMNNISKLTLRDTIQLFHDIAGLDMNLEER